MEGKVKGKIYRLKLYHNQGFAYSIVLDYTSEYPFDGRLLYIFDLSYENSRNSIDLLEVLSHKIEFGPVLLHAFPRTKGKGKWENLGETSQFDIQKWPIFKKYHGNMGLDDNWSNLDKWYLVNRSIPITELNFVAYEELRSLETTILNTFDGVAIKITMMKLINKGLNVRDYFDLETLENKVLFIQLINTYYPLKKCIHLLKDI